MIDKLETSARLVELSSGMYDALNEFIGDPVNDATIARINECIKVYIRSVLKLIDLPEVDFSKLGIVTAEDYLTTGLLDPNPYTAQVLKNIFEAVEQERYLHTTPNLV